MRSDRNVIKWHYVIDQHSHPTGLRGWGCTADARNQTAEEEFEDDES